MTSAGSGPGGGRALTVHVHSGFARPAWQVKSCSVLSKQRAVSPNGDSACFGGSDGIWAGRRKTPIPHDPAVYRQRHKIENMFGRHKDWRRVHTRYDRCAHTFLSTFCIAAIFLINQ